MDGGQLLERDVVLAAISDLLDGVRIGRGGALFVVGEPGLGKTSCLVRARALAAPEVQVGWGGGDAMETSLPFGPCASALSAVGYGDLLEAPPAGEGFGDVRASRFHGVWRWLRDTTGPVLLCLDDLHWADPDSLALLSFLCRRLAELPVSLLATLRPWPPPAHELASALAHDGKAGVQQLMPLSEDAAATLLSARLGATVTQAVAHTAAELCAGNPLLLEQVAVSISQRGQLDCPLAAGTAISAESIVLTRFAGLPSDALRVAQAASVLGTRFRPALAVEVAGLEDRRAQPALEALCGSGLVYTETATTAGFVHPLFGQSLYHDMAVPVRARLHARAFTVLSERGLEAEAVEHAVRADLIGDRTAIAVVERAGRAAMATGATGTAIEHFRAAVRLAGERPTSALLLVLGEALVVGCRPAEAIDVYERLRTQADLDPLDRVQALRMLGRALQTTGALDQAIQRFREAVAMAEDCNESIVAEVLLGGAIMFWSTLGPAHALPLVTRARELTKGAAGPLRQQVAANWGLVTLLSGDPAGLPACDAAAGELIQNRPGRLRCAGASGRWVVSPSPPSLLSVSTMLNTPCPSSWPRPTGSVP
ncbi:MAG TPA: AAA family ATPase [Pseudonocardiaceae bacterium]